MIIQLHDARPAKPAWPARLVRPARLAKKSSYSKSRLKSNSKTSLSSQSQMKKKSQLRCVLMILVQQKCKWCPYPLIVTKAGLNLASRLSGRAIQPSKMNSSTSTLISRPSFQLKIRSSLSYSMPFRSMNQREICQCHTGMKIEWPSLR